MIDNSNPSKLAGLWAPYEPNDQALDDGRFEVRQKATRELEQLAEPALRKALD